MRHARCLRLWVFVGLCLAVVGCGESSPDPDCEGDACGAPGGPAATSFESDVPDGLGSSSGDKAESGPAGGTLGTRGAAAPTASTPGQAAADSSSNSGRDDGAARAIAEADIIQVQGERLYALSRIAGLAVIDVQNPSALKLLGRFRELPAEPFELYVREGVALVMFSSWGQYQLAADGGYTYTYSSKLLALDVSSPAAIKQIGSFDVPGTISDSRLVGDVLYIVSYENGSCWGCEQSKARTVISSLSVKNPQAVQKIEELAFRDDNQAYAGPKSITVTTQRMYVSGPEYSREGQPQGSAVRVVDISKPDGDLVEGATVQVKGQINSRWQMDEHEGVLRVISQPLQWFTPQGQQVSTAPAVETFRIESSSKLSALGKLDLQIPIRETLRSARFDGPRAYAITAEQKDPLFIIDLSDAANPRQLGHLEMPGFVWHMEPRGERLLGVGYDNGNPKGGLTVSLFDVKDMNKPLLLSRVNFGGTWGSLPADQDRAHKVFRVLDDVGLVLVPFSGWDSGGSVNEERFCGGKYVGGVQLIDFKDDALELRGAAPAVGEARRALLQHDQLLTVSDERVQAYDITNRDAPKQTSEVVLARQVFQALQLDNGAVARFSYESNTGIPSVDFVGADAAGDANQSLAQLKFDEVAGGTSTEQCSKSFSVEQVLVHGSELDLVYVAYSNTKTGLSTSTRGVLAIDASVADKPVVKSDTHWTNDENWSYYSDFYSYGYYSPNQTVVRTTSAITMLETSWEVTPVSKKQLVRLRVLDMRDPSKVSTKLLQFPALARYSGLIADGDTVLTSHLIANTSNAARARFYIDRFDVSNPSDPHQLSSVNVPGALLHYDASSQRALTNEQKRVVVSDVTYEECSKRFAYQQWVDPRWNNGGVNGVSRGGSAPVATATPPSASGASDAPMVPTAPVEQPKGECTGFVQSLHLVQLQSDAATLVDSLKLDEDQQLGSSSMGDGVMFATLGRGGYYGRPLVGPAIAAVDCAGPCGGFGVVSTPEPSELLVLGMTADALQVGRIEVEQGQTNAWWGFWGSPNVYASGKRALLVGQSDVAVIDAANATEPKIAKRVPLIASVQFVHLRADTALLTLGAQGVQWLSMQ